MSLNLPNRITLGRLFLSVAFFVVLSFYSQRHPNATIAVISLALFSVAALTDFLDGYLARKRNEVTALVRVLDPFADKLLVCGAFVMLAGPAFCGPDGRNVIGLEPWMVVVILGRELFVTGVRGFSESRGIAFGAEFVGKAKMWVQSITIVIVLAALAWWDTHPGSFAGRLMTLCVWLTVLVTAASLGSYLIKARAALTKASAA